MNGNEIAPGMLHLERDELWHWERCVALLILNQGTEIEVLQKELTKAQAKLEKIKAAEKKEAKATAKPAAKKPAVRKTVKKEAE